MRSFEALKIAFLFAALIVLASFWTARNLPRAAASRVQPRCGAPAQAAGLRACRRPAIGSRWHAPPPHSFSSSRWP